MKKRYYISFALVLLVTMLILGTTYAYYKTKINGNAKDKSISVLSKYLAVKYSDGTSTMNFDGDYFFPGDSAEKTFSVENTGSDKTTYSIKIDNVVNEFERIQDIRYNIYINEEEVSSGAINNSETQYLYYEREIEKGSKDNIKLIVSYSETEESQNVDMNKTLSFRVNIDNKKENKTSGSSVTFLENGNTLENYRIYGNSVQGQNLFDSSKAVAGENFYLANGTVSAQNEVSVYYIEAKPNISYKFSKSVENKNYIRIALTDENKGFIKRMDAYTVSSGTFTTTEDTKYIQVAIDNVLLNKVSIYQLPTPDYPLEIESVGDLVTDTNDENYGKYKIPVTISGKNMWTTDIIYPVTSLGHELINYDSATQIFTLDEAFNGKSQSIYKLENPIPAGTKVTVYMYVLEGNIGGTIVFGGYHNGDDNKSWQGTINLSENKNEDLSGKVFKNTYVTTDTVTDFWAFLNLGYQINSPLKFKMMYVIGDDESNAFEPYIEPVTTNIYLDEPLRKIGDYADYIDFKEQKVVRKIKEYTFKGEESFVLFPNTNNFYTLNLEDAKYELNIKCLSNMYGSNNSGEGTEYSSGIWVQSTNTYKRLYIANSNYTTADAFKNNIKTLYESNTPLIVDYILNTSTEKIRNLPNISTVNGTTVLTVNTNVGVSNIEINN